MREDTINAIGKTELSLLGVMIDDFKLFEGSKSMILHKDGAVTTGGSKSMLWSRLCKDTVTVDFMAVAGMLADCIVGKGENKNEELLKQLNQVIGDNINTARGRENIISTFFIACKTKQLVRDHPINDIPDSETILSYFETSDGQRYYFEMDKAKKVYVTRKGFKASSR